MGDRITAPPPHGIARTAALEFMLDGAARAPKGAIHIIYGGNYDLNMMLGGLTKNELWAIRHYRSAQIRGYRIQWRAGKSFTISDLDNEKRRITVYDVGSFFQRPFVDACDEYLGTDWLARDIIVREKANRSNFLYEDLLEITEYNDAELVNLRRLAEELRSRLYRAGIRVTRWDGPGAIAASLLKRYGVKTHMATLPEPVRSAARYAYAGGRFELLKFGHSDERVWQYDVRSAYPTALRRVRCLAHGTFIHRENTDAVREFGLYHVSWNFSDKHAHIPKPFFVRYPKGTVAYPAMGSGWYWGPEVMAVRDAGWDFEVLECWEFEAMCDHEPFGFIDGLYSKRAILKRAGDGAHVGIKLGLNSLYGKTAQQVGWEPGPPLRIPPFHQLEWAGFATSHCRAAVWTAAMQAPMSIVAFETDALFTTEPLNLPMSESLGDWESTEYANMTYIQSGMYFADKMDGSRVAKTRGVDKGKLTRDDVVSAMQLNKMFVEAPLTRFVGAGIALTQNFDRWRTWETQIKQIRLEPSGKTAHMACTDECGTRGWHYADCWIMTNLHSSEFPIEWENPNPEMVIDDDDTTPAMARAWRDLHDEYA
jgi:hypothetical protein